MVVIYYFLKLRYFNNFILMRHLLRNMVFSNEYFLSIYIHLIKMIQHYLLDYHLYLIFNQRQLYFNFRFFNLYFITEVDNLFIYNMINTFFIN